MQANSAPIHQRTAEEDPPQRPLVVQRRGWPRRGASILALVASPLWASGHIASAQVASGQVPPAQTAPAAAASPQAVPGQLPKPPVGGTAAVTPKAPPPAVTGASAPPPAASSEAERGSDAKLAGLSGAQLRARGEAAVDAISKSRDQVRVLLGGARDKRDVVKVLCLDDRNTQVNVAFKTSLDRKDALNEAVLADLRERARHELTLLLILKDRVDVLVGEAGQCIGEETGFTGDSVLSVEVDPNLAESDTQNVPFVPAISNVPSLSTAVD